MGTPSRTLLALAALVASGSLLAGCSLFGPARDADGRVTDTSVIGSTDLLVGDCFSFVEGSENSEAEVTPCENEHSYIVIGEGTLSASAVDEAGSLQNAVSVACADPFTEFKAAATDGSKPEQEFIVSTRQEDGKEVTTYHCVATDAAIVAAE